MANATGNNRPIVGVRRHQAVTTIRKSVLFGLISWNVVAKVEHLHDDIEIVTHGVKYRKIFIDGAPWVDQRRQM